MSSDPIEAALEGPAPPTPDLNSDLDTLHLALRWLLEQETLELPNGDSIEGQEAYTKWLDVIERRRLKPNNRPYGGEFIAERLTAQLVAVGYDGPRVSYAAIKRWWRRKAI